MATIAGSRANSPRSRSAGGHEEQPWLVKSSTTARGGSACAERLATETAMANAAGNATWRCIQVFASVPIRARSSGRRLRMANVSEATQFAVSGREATSIPPAMSGGEPPEHVVQDAAVLEIVELFQRVDPRDQRHALEAAVGPDDFRDQALMRLQLAGDAADRHRFVSLEAEGLPRRALLEHERQHAHADQVGAVNALERLGDHRANAEQRRALSGPVARGTGA